MGLELSAAADGASTASADGLLLHSAHRPREEGIRFAASIEDGHSAFLILGPCLGHMIEGLRDRFPGAMIIGLQFDPGFRSVESAKADHCWYPDDPISVDAFLLRILSPEDLESLLVLPWPPAIRAYGAIARACQERIKSAMLALNGTANALSAFGPSFLYNALKNSILASRRAVLAAPGGRPCLIAASGPSLEAQIPFIALHRESIYLAALSSALACLTRAGLEPDIVFTADPGFWAAYHLEPYPRGVPIAAPLEARIPSPLLARDPLLVLGGQSLWAEAIGESGSGLPIRTTATVAAAAVEACLSLVSGPLILAGLDLSSKDGRSHARPNAFDAIRDPRANRLEPIESIEYALSAESRPNVAPISGSRFFATPQLESYRGYFTRACAAEPRISRLASESPPIAGMPELSLAEASGRIRAFGVPDRRDGPRFDLREPSGTGDSRRGKELAAQASELLAKACRAYLSDEELSPLDRETLSCLCFSSLLKRRKARRGGPESLLEAGAADLDSRRRRLVRRFEALGARARP